MIFLKCKIRFIYVGFNCKRKKSGVKNVWKFVPLRGGEGVGRLMANAILHFHFDYLKASLRWYNVLLKLSVMRSGLVVFNYQNNVSSGDAQNAKNAGLYTFCKTCWALRAITPLRIWQNVLLHTVILHSKITHLLQNVLKSPQITPQVPRSV